MINPAPYIRTQFFALLNNAISYEGNNVPVYDSEGKDTDPIKIVFGEFTGADDSNKTTFNTRARQVIEVISQHPKGMRKAVDVVGRAVTTTIQPDRHTDTMSGDEFQVMLWGGPSVNYLDDVSGSGAKLIRLILGYDMTIVQREH